MRHPRGEWDYRSVYDPLEASWLSLNKADLSR